MFSGKKVTRCTRGTTGKSLSPRHLRRVQPRWRGGRLRRYNIVDAFQEPAVKRQVYSAARKLVCEAG
jgi:hypothetical protein